MEKEIQALEARQTELTAELEKPETYEKAGRAHQINRELADVQHRLETLAPEWEAAAGKLADGAIKGKVEMDRNGETQSRDWEAKKQEDKK